MKLNFAIKYITIGLIDNSGNLAMNVFNTIPGHAPVCILDRYVSKLQEKRFRQRAELDLQWRPIEIKKL